LIFLLVLVPMLGAPPFPCFKPVPVLVLGSLFQIPPVPVLIPGSFFKFLRCRFLVPFLKSPGADADSLPFQFMKSQNSYFSTSSYSR
jgi:hypothetical protein